MCRAFERLPLANVSRIFAKRQSLFGAFLSPIWSGFHEDDHCRYQALPA
jgi:hypothetical protein